MNINIKITDDNDHERLFAEIYINNEFIIIVSEEIPGEYLVEIDHEIKINADVLIEAINIAVSKLKLMDQ